METWKNYLEQNKKRFLDELLALLRIPSVSADPKHKDDILKTAEYVKQKLIEAGADKVELMPTGGNPIVYGEKIIDPKKPTVLCYGHYDVQPPDPLNLWTSPPFEPIIKDDTIYARGSSDDKGQMFMHVKAFEMMMRTNSLPCNIKFIIEGEEEVGSANLPTFLEKQKEKLKADVTLISDTSMIAMETPSIEVGLRGLAYLEVEVTGPNRDLHSGVYGGAVGNPINILCKMIASMKDENNHVTIPGFYDDVIELTKAEREELNKAPYNEGEYKKDLGVDELEGEKGYTTLERTGTRPTLELNGIWGGYTGEGAKTVLPSKAFAKISMRLVPNQKSKKMEELFTKHFMSIAPKSVKVKVTALHGGEAGVVPTDSLAYKAGAKAIETTFGKKPIPTRGGGSIPIVADFENILGLKTMLMGFGLDSDNLHSPNEHYGLVNFYKGIETIPYFFKYFTEMKG
jgi:acetylornithine deacetylase/succinyl-diaminopimelate desuccinylase-like protein